jgi:hypothetical protein
MSRCGLCAAEDRQCRACAAADAGTRADIRAARAEGFVLGVLAAAVVALACLVA